MLKPRDCYWPVVTTENYEQHMKDPTVELVVVRKLPVRAFPNIGTIFRYLDSNNMKGYTVLFPVPYRKNMKK
jgi:hypothetical protein